MDLVALVSAFLGGLVVDHSYHQTQAQLTIDQREHYEITARTQEELVLAFFQDRPGLAYSPERVQELVLPSAPITSVRRALTNLTEAGELRKAEQMVPGRYGRPVCQWTLAKVEPSGQLELF